MLKAVGLDSMDPPGRKRLFGETVGPRLKNLDYYARENRMIQVEKNIQKMFVNKATEKPVDLSQSHQFAIDEEVLAQSSFTNGITGLSAKKPVRKRVRKGLSLTDYLEKKAAGTL